MDDSRRPLGRPAAAGDGSTTLDDFLARRPRLPGEPDPPTLQDFYDGLSTEATAKHAAEFVGYARAPAAPEEPWGPWRIDECTGDDHARELKYPKGLAAAVIRELDLRQLCGEHLGNEIATWSEQYSKPERERFVEDIRQQSARMHLMLFRELVKLVLQRKIKIFGHQKGSKDDEPKLLSVAELERATYVLLDDDIVMGINGEKSVMIISEVVSVKSTLAPMSHAPATAERKELARAIFGTMYDQAGSKPQNVVKAWAYYRKLVPAENRLSKTAAKAILDEPELKARRNGPGAPSKS